MVQNEETLITGMQRKPSPHVNTVDLLFDLPFIFNLPLEQGPQLSTA